MPCTLLSRAFCGAYGTALPLDSDEAESDRIYRPQYYDDGVAGNRGTATVHETGLCPK